MAINDSRGERVINVFIFCAKYCLQYFYTSKSHFLIFKDWETIKSIKAITIIEIIEILRDKIHSVLIQKNLLQHDKYASSFKDSAENIELRA